MIADTIPEENPQELPAGMDTREKVLLVDDDETHLEILRHGLEYQGFEVVTLSSAENLLQQVVAHKPDAIILDVYLPGGNGLEICQELMDSPATAMIPVIILSGSIESTIVRQARAAGCRYFLSKPFDPNTLLMAVRQSIDEC